MSDNRPPLEELLGRSGGENPNKQKLSREEQDRQWQENNRNYRDHFARLGYPTGLNFIHRPLNPEPEEVDQLKDAPAIESATDPIRRPRPGLYHVEQNGKKQPYDIYLNENNSVQLLNGNRSINAFDNEGWARAMDFIGGQMGCDTLVFNVPGHHPSKAKRDLRGMLELAAERAEKGMSVEFGHDTEEFLKTLKPEERKEFYDRRDQINSVARQAKWLVDATDTSAFTRSNDKIVKQNNEHKLDGTESGERLESFRDKIGLKKEGLSDDDKIKLIEADIKKLTERIEETKKVGVGLSELKAREEEFIKKPPVDLVRSSGALRRKANYRTVKAAFRLAVNKTRDAETPTEILSALQKLESKGESGLKERTQLRETLEKELRNIEERIGMLKNELAGLKEPLEKQKRENEVKISATNPPLAEPDKQRLIEENKNLDLKIKKMEDKIKQPLEKLEQLKSDKDGELNRVKQSRDWDEKPQSGQQLSGRQDMIAQERDKHQQAMQQQPRTP